MADKLTAYKAAEQPLPERYWLWPVYGRDFENVGRDGQPIEVDLPAYGPDQLLVRHDACGICFSDIKVIRAGPAHPRLLGRDMRADPVVLGHEVTLTVVAVGEKLREQFAVGQRYVVQADVYYQGRNLAYGYALQGGQSQYSVLGDEVLRGDDGCYLIPVQPETGYAQAALTEPWACVEAAYNIHYREGLKPGGAAWIIGSPSDDRPYQISQGFDAEAHPATLVISDVPAGLAAWLKSQSERLGVKLIEHDELDLADFPAIQAAAAPDGFDDVILLGPASAELIAQSFCALARGGLLNLVSDRPYAEPTPIDTGWLHYDHMTIVGNPGPDIAASYPSRPFAALRMLRNWSGRTSRPVRSTLRPGGRLWLLGAAGPMGQMHLQRALAVPPHPARIVATNRSSNRIAGLLDRFGPSAEMRSVQLITLTEESLGKQAFHERLWELTEGQGFDDIVIMAPSSEAIEEAAQFLAPGGVMNLFAGMKRGTDCLLNLNPLRDERQVRFIGSSGSSIPDLRRIVELTEQGLISPQEAVSAVTGLAGVRDALQAVSEGRFPGKVVIYPHIRNLGLTPLPDLRKNLPRVFVKLAYGRVWTQAAEDELLRTLLDEE